MNGHASVSLFDERGLWGLGLGLGPFLRSQSLEKTSGDVSLFLGPKGQFCMQPVGSRPGQAARGRGWPVGTGGVLPVAGCRLLPTLPEAPA